MHKPIKPSRKRIDSPPSPLRVGRGGRLALREWLVLSLILITFYFVLLFTELLKQFDNSFYDFLIKNQTQAPRKDIVIVAIDDYSLNELGKWPWSRDIHATLIQQLHQYQAKAIGLDLLMSETSMHDKDFIAQLDAQRNVVIPMSSINAGQGLSAGMPTLEIANSVYGLGHIHIELDKDGVARSVFLREGMNGQWWPHFSLRLMQMGEQKEKGFNYFDKDNEKLLPRTERNPRFVDASTGELYSYFEKGVWHRDFQMRIPYLGGSGHFTSVPYVAVLRGEVPESFMKDKYVIVGATATGMADAYPTPVTSQTGVLSGVEINANILAALLNQKSIVPISQNIQIMWGMIFIILTMLALFRLTPRNALIVFFVLISSLLILSFYLLKQGWWLAPANIVLIISMAYPLWGWRRLEAASEFLREELYVLNQEPHLLPEKTVSTNQPTSSLEFNTITQSIHHFPERIIHDKLEKQIMDVQLATQRVRDLRQFITDSLQSLPDGTLVATIDGEVILANSVAIDYFKSMGSPQVIDALVPYLFSSMQLPSTTVMGNDERFSWWHILDLKQTRILAQGVEVVDPKHRDILIKSAPCYSSQQEHIGWIISIIDISNIRSAERKREEMLNFISHDIRSPQASILALIDMQRDGSQSLTQEELLSRIEKSSRTTLALADDFVQLAKAESQHYRLMPHDFQDILLDATEEMWSMAKNKKIKIHTDIPDGEYPVYVDRSLITRAISNLISNAIKYSPEKTCVYCSLKTASINLVDYVVCEIRDEGYGITQADQKRLFQKFQRFHDKHDSHNTLGVGLGMVFVKTVLDKHLAMIDFISEVNKGTTFIIKMPAR